MFTLLTVATSYICVSIVITLVIPYYMLDVTSPFVSAYDYVGFYALKTVVTVGAIISITTWLVQVMLSYSSFV